MLRTLCFGFICVSLWSSSLASAQSAGQLPLPPLEPFIEQLGHRDYRLREQAGQQLEARGAEALPLLRKAVGTVDPEIRRRVAVLTAKIERQVLLTPKRVTLDLRNRPFKDAIKELSQLSGYKLILENAPMQNVTIQMKDVTFWEALDRLCQEGGMVVGGDDGDNALRLFQQDTYSPYVTYSGPFRIMGMSMNSNKNVNLAFLPRRAMDNNNQQFESLSFSFQVNTEPKTALLGIGMATLTKAEDQDGQTLMFREDDPNNPYRANYQPQNLYRAPQMQGQLMLSRTARTSLKARVIAGKIPVVLLSEVRPEITINDLLKVKKGHYEGTNIAIDLESVQNNKPDVQITLSIKRLGKNVPEDDNWANSVFQRLELYDAKGNKFPAQGINNFINSSPHHVEAVFQFGKDNTVGPPSRLVYSNWETMTHDIPFQFKDLPLP